MVSMRENNKQGLNLIKQIPLKISNKVMSRTLIFHFYDKNEMNCILYMKAYSNNVQT